MSNVLRIKRSLISVSDKGKIVPFAKDLAKEDIEIISTGNTFKELKKNKINVTNIEEVTSFPEILSGRVKTLHPKIFGGILANKLDQSHTRQLKQHSILEIQLVVVNLYPFKETIKTSNKINKCIENIDIGGPSLIRAAAKNFLSTAIITDKDDYKKVINEIKKLGGISIELRKFLAIKAFKKTMQYDSAIFNWFSNKITKNQEEYLNQQHQSIHLIGI